LFVELRLLTILKISVGHIQRGRRGLLIFVLKMTSDMNKVLTRKWRNLHKVRLMFYP